MALMTDDGSFSDINYSDRELATWEPYTHLTRLKTLTAIYSTESNKNYGKEELMTAVINGLHYWYRNRESIYSGNWWYNDRAVPEVFADILMFDLPGLSEECRTYMVEKALTRYLDTETGIGTLRSYNSTGQGVSDRLSQSLKLVMIQNLSTEKAYNEIARLTSYMDQELTLETGAVGLFSDVNDTQNIRADFSYQEHGNLLLTGSYGREFVNSTANYLEKLEDTDLFLSKEAAENLGHVLLAFSQSQRNGYMDLTTTGRAYGTHGNTLKPSMRLSYLYESILSHYPDCDNAAAMRAQLEHIQSGYSGEAPSNDRYFWQSDYLAHNRSGYHFSVRSASSRSRTSEHANGQGYLGRYMGDGVISLTKSGTEYEGLSPVLDWNKMPGTTLNQSQSSLFPDEAYGNTDVVGGVSNGSYGMQMFDYNRDGVAAKKAWFAFDDEVVALGSGIASEKSGDIFTTVNQCALNGSVTFKKQGSAAETAEQGSQTVQNAEWVLHDGVGYWFMNPTDVLLQKQSVTGDWSGCDTNYSDEEKVTKDVFLLGQSHGEKPTDGSYAYILLPQTNKAALENYQSPVSVLSNTKALQAVWHSGLNMMQAAFYNSGTVQFGGHTVTVSDTCALLWVQTDSGYELYVSNPKNEALNLTVTVDGNSVSFSAGIGSRGNDGGRTYRYESATGSITPMQ